MSFSFSCQADWSVLRQIAKKGQTLIHTFDRQACEAVGGIGWALVKRGIGAVHSAWGGVYGDEADQIADVLGLPSRDIIAANLAYDVSPVGCSTFIAPAKEGLLHARNLDWWFPRNLLKRHVVIGHGIPKVNLAILRVVQRLKLLGNMKITRRGDLSA